MLLLLLLLVVVVLLLRLHLPLLPLTVLPFVGQHERCLLLLLLLQVQWCQQNVLPAEQAVIQAGRDAPAVRGRLCKGCLTAVWETKQQGCLHVVAAMVWPEREGDFLLLLLKCSFW